MKRHAAVSTPGGVRRYASSMEPRTTDNTQEPTFPPELLCLDAAVRYLGGLVSRESVRTWTKNGTLRPIHIGRRLFIRRAEIDALVARQIE